MSKLVVLVAANSPICQNILVNNLKKMDFSSVVPANDGIEALDKMHVENIDFIITDLDDQKMDGLEFTKTVKSVIDFKSIPIIIISKNRSKENIINAFKAGADSYLIKPFNFRTFEKKIEKFLEKNHFETEG